MVAATRPAANPGGAAKGRRGNGQRRPLAEHAVGEGRADRAPPDDQEIAVRDVDAGRGVQDGGVGDRAPGCASQGSVGRRTGQVDAAPIPSLDDRGTRLHEDRWTGLDVDVVAQAGKDFRARLGRVTGVEGRPAEVDGSLRLDHAATGNEELSAVEREAAVQEVAEGVIVDRIVRRVDPGQLRRGKAGRVDDRAVEGDGVEPVLVAGIVRHAVLKVDSGGVEVDRGIVEAAAHARVPGLRRHAVAVEVVIGDDRPLGTVQLDTKPAGPEKAALVDDHGWWIRRGEGAKDRVVSDEACRARQLKRQAAGRGKRHRATKGNALDLEGIGHRRSGCVERQVDSLGSDVVHRSKLAVRLALDQHRRVGDVDSVEVRRTDSAIDHGQPIGKLLGEVHRVGRGRRAARDRDRVQRVLNAGEGQ